MLCTQPDQVFALVDCNNFYANCERLFRPDLRHRPVVVLSNNDGCVVARSDEAKALGIAMGAPFFKVKDLIRQHRVSVFSSNYTLYADISQRVMSLISAMAPEVEVYSIDEVFLDLSQMASLAHERALYDHGQRIRQRVAQWVGVPVRVGIGRSKTLAKLANYAAKTYPAYGGVVVLLTPEREQRLLQLTPVQEVWGIGRQLTRHLKQQGIETAWQLACLDPEYVRQQFSVVLERTVRELRGESCLSLDEVQSKQQIISSRSFGQPITSLQAMRQAVSEYSAIAAAKLRQEQQQARQVSVLIQTNRYAATQPYYYNSTAGRLPYATNDTRAITQLALALLQRLWRPNYRYNKAGVMLSDFYAIQHYQLSLFDDAMQSGRSSSLMQTIDQLNQHRPGTLRFASQGSKQRHWNMQRRYLSPCYTTKWRDIARVT